MKKPLLTLLAGITSLFASAQVINVSTSNELQTALNNAQPGHIITLKPNTRFSISTCTNCITNNGSGFKVPKGINGTENNPIKLVGDKSSIIASENIATKYGLHLQGNNYWVIDGFTVTNSSKCVMLDSSSHNVINNLKITNSGYEALHLRKFSSYNNVSNCYIDSTGMYASAASSGYAEGIYVGTANSNWIDFSNNQVDTCNYNVLTSNVFGDNIKSENIDIKEGTKGGEISYNTFNGKGCNGANSADKYVDIKGDNYVIKCNTGSKNSTSIVNGFEVNINKITTKNGLVVNKNFGDYNTFSNNTLDLAGSTGSGTKAGFAIFVNSYSGVIHNTVCSSNVGTNVPSGMTNLTTTVCQDVCKVVTNINSNNFQTSEIVVSPNPFENEINLIVNHDVIVQILDVNGIVYLESSLAKGNATLNTSSLNKGIYLLKVISNNNEIEYKKIVRL